MIRQYSYSKGKQLQGLANRRNDEARLLLDTTPSVGGAVLSPSAQASFNSKTLTGTPTVQGQVIEELQKAGVFDQ